MKLILENPKNRKLKTKVNSVLKSEKPIPEKIQDLRKELPPLDRSEESREKLLEIRAACRVLKAQAFHPDEIKALFILSEETTLRLQYPGFKF